MFGAAVQSAGNDVGHDCSRLADTASANLRAPRTLIRLARHVRLAGCINGRVPFLIISQSDCDRTSDDSVAHSLRR